MSEVDIEIFADMEQIKSGATFVLKIAGEYYKAKKLKYIAEKNAIIKLFEEFLWEDESNKKGE